MVRVADEQGPLPVGAFAERIAARRRDQEQLLTESERRILEDALLTRLAQQIHERTVDARDLIGQMDTEMRARRMSSGITVGVAGSSPTTSTTSSGRSASCSTATPARPRPGRSWPRMRGHFAAQIKAARARAPRAALPGAARRGARLPALAGVRRSPCTGPDGSEERLTRARHSQLSGGEQSVSLHLPLFAAAHAMLNSADPHAPAAARPGRGVRRASTTTAAAS